MTPIVRRGSRADLEPLIGLLQQLSLGEPREDPVALAAYERAFEAIEADPRQTLLMCEVEGAVAGTGRHRRCAQSEPRREALCGGRDRGG